MKIIIGLGNPGDEYVFTRHNAGFMVIDALCEKLKISLNKQGFDGIYEKIKVDDQEVIIAKPLTYMNKSGTFVSKICSFYKIKIDEILVICDDLDTPIGKVRIKSFGSSGGQNGLKDIELCLGTNNFKKMKIGIGRPTNKNEVINYVLSKIKNEDKQKFLSAVDVASSAAIEWIYNNYEKIISKYNMK